MTEQTFKVGDKVRAFGTREGVVTYGPIASTFSRHTLYAVKETVSGNEVAHHVGDLRAVPAAPAFAVGDIVTLRTRDARATVEYGPFDNTNRRVPETYVVKLVDPPADDSPRTFTALASVMEKVAAPEPIKAGDRIRVTKTGSRGALVSAGEILTVRAVTDREVQVDGYGRGDRWYLSPDDVEKVTDEPTDPAWTYNGVTYAPDVDYIDKDGDPWQFAVVDGELYGDYGSSRRSVTSHSYSIGYAVNTYGPFYRR
ncbi:hypothetical protein ACIQUY_04885 [Streptomyces sp. NPDC090231]|uniref:hypothetical protein n=1 Tax=unclassified Streptomyces TaxID=2593676 RepID=UPI003818EBDA